MSTKWLKKEYCLELADAVNGFLLEDKITRKKLERDGLSRAVIDSFFVGRATFNTVKKIELVLRRQFLRRDGKADNEHGEYSSEEAGAHIGKFLFIRPYFTQPIISTYFVEIYWNELENCLTFEERERKDSQFSQKGEVCITKDHPFLNLLTVVDGNVRNIMLSFPQKGERYYRGLIFSLAKPSGLAWVPACAPVAMRRVAKDEAVELGTHKAGENLHVEYRKVLESIEPDYALFSRMNN